jgi:hypothetical protein
LEGTTSRAVDDRSVGRFFEAVAALNTLGVRVVRLVADHNAFQEIENELRGLADDLAQLRWSWPLIFERQQRICSNNPASWAAELANGARDLESAVALGQPEKLQISFDRYQSRLKRNFVSTDKDLLTCCETLRQIAPSLAFVFDAAQ